MWYAIVGNGPSSANPANSKIVDSCRYVIRLTQFRLHFPNSESGTKIDAWAHYGSRTMLQRKGVIPAGNYEVWFTQPTHRAEHGNHPGLPSLYVAKKYAEHRPVEKVKDEVWQETAQSLHIYGGSKQLRPTTGLTAIAMALHHEPVGLMIVGFDATTPDRSGWGDNKEVESWREVGTHDHLAEKKMIANLVDDRSWCGRKVSTKVVWMGRPKL